MQEVQYEKLKRMQESIERVNMITKMPPTSSALSTVFMVGLQFTANIRGGGWCVPYPPGLVLVEDTCLYSISKALLSLCSPQSQGPAVDLFVYTYHRFWK